jgi:hypothetical protein
MPRGATLRSRARLTPHFHHLSLELLIHQPEVVTLRPGLFQLLIQGLEVAHSLVEEPVSLVPVSDLCGPVLLPPTLDMPS